MVIVFQIQTFFLIDEVCCVLYIGLTFLYQWVKEMIYKCGYSFCRTAIG